MRHFSRNASEKCRTSASTDGRTVLFVSHNMAAIKRLCDSAILLCGRIDFQGKSDEAIDRYMTTSANRSGCRRWTTSDNDAPGAKAGKARLISVTILNEAGAATGSIGITEIS